MHVLPIYCIKNRTVGLSLICISVVRIFKYANKHMRVIFQDTPHFAYKDIMAMFIADIYFEPHSDLDSGEEAVFHQTL